MKISTIFNTGSPKEITAIKTALESIEDLQAMSDAKDSDLRQAKIDCDQAAIDYKNATPENHAALIQARQRVADLQIAVEQERALGSLFDRKADVLRAPIMDSLPVIMERIDQVPGLMKQFTAGIETVMGMPAGTCPQPWLMGLNCLKAQVTQFKASAPTAPLDVLVSMARDIIE